MLYRMDKHNGHRKSEKEKKKLSWKQGEHVIDIEVFFLKKIKKMILHNVY